MSKEIKEILDKPKILMLSYGNYISLDDYTKLKDYITKLQEENKELLLELSGYRKAILNDDNLMGLKSRIDKTLEYIGSGKVRVMEYVEDFNTPIYTDWKLIEILKGG